MADNCDFTMKGLRERLPEAFSKVTSETCLQDPLAGYGFDLHAKQSVPAGDAKRLERLTRYILRSPLTQSRLKRRADGRIALRQKKPWRNGTQGMLFEPLHFLGKLAALVPPPRGAGGAPPRSQRAPTRPAPASLACQLSGTQIPASTPTHSRVR